MILNRLLIGLIALATVLPAQAAPPAPAPPPVAQEGQGFEAWATGQTLRLDLFHSGIAGVEHLAIDRVRREGAWPGSVVRLLDDTNLGKYFLRVVDPATQRTLYSRGFASIYGEWETTGEARSGTWGTIHESVRFPEPRKPVQVVIAKRAGDGTFQQIFSTLVDPGHRSIDRSPLPEVGELWTLRDSGPAATKVDVLILGDGYTLEERSKFLADAKRAEAALFASEPFKSRAGDFNVRALHPPSQDSGVTDPRAEAWRNTPLGLSYNAFDSERYVLTFANRELREIAAQAPYDALILLANNRKYGGGGIFNLWTTAAADSAEADYLVVHEFGHSFAGLGDEYYTSQVSYEDFNPPGVEPWEPNVTALLPDRPLKWSHLKAEETPVPTPWEQEGYDEISLAYQQERQALRKAGASEERMEELFDKVRETTRPLLESERYASEVGAFEGAGYQAKGLYRPQVDCIMFTRNPKNFCVVCSEAVSRVIDLYAQ
jgi:hypothetical protein